MKNTLFPIFLKTQQLRFLVIGGGKVGLEKTSALLRQNPETRIKLIATIISDELKSLLQQHGQANGRKEHCRYRSYQHRSCPYSYHDTELNRRIKALANNRGILVNAADQPDLCDFYLGAIVNKGHVKMAISTNGQSPVMARRLKEYFTDVIPADIDEGVAELNAIRKQHKGDLAAKLEQLNQLTAAIQGKKVRKKYKRLTFEISLAFFAIFLGYGLSSYISFGELKAAVASVPSIFYIMLVVGFFAQLVDGAIGLGYGVVCATTMMLAGVRLPAISGSIHTAEMFSSGISGYSHYKFGNVSKKTFFVSGNTRSNRRCIRRPVAGLPGQQI